MRLGDVIQRVSALYSRGIERSNNKLSERHIYNKLVTSRSILLYRKINKKQKINDLNYQTLGCVEFSIDGDLFKSNERIPTIINSLDNDVVKYVFSSDNEITYSYINVLEKRFRASNKYTSLNPYYILDNSYIYINKVGSENKVSIRALFENPLDVFQHPFYCSNSTSNFLDFDFPVDNTLLDPLIQMCVEELIMLFQKPKENEENDKER